MADDVQLGTRIAKTLKQRLRLFASLQEKPMKHVLSVLLDQALPQVDEMAGLLIEQGRGQAVIAINGRSRRGHRPALAHSGHRQDTGDGQPPGLRA